MPIIKCNIQSKVTYYELEIYILFEIEGCKMAFETINSIFTDDRNNGGGVFGTRTSTTLFTILILVIIVLGAGGRIFGGYGNYPGYGGFSEYGYTIPKSRRRYRYDPYNIYDD